MNKIQALEALHGINQTHLQNASIGGTASSSIGMPTEDLSAKFSELMKRAGKEDMAVLDTTPSALRQHIDSVGDSAIENLEGAHDVGTPGASPGEQIKHTVEIAKQSAENFLRLTAYAHLAKSSREGVQTLVKNQ